MFRTTALLLFLLLSFVCFSQTEDKVDSLTTELERAKHDTTKINLQLQIGDLYLYSHPEKTIEIAQKMAASSQRSSYPKGLCNSLFLEGSALSQKSQYDKALQKLEKALGIARQHDLKTRELNILLQMGVVYDMTSNNEKAREIYQQIFDEASVLGMKKLSSSALQNLAILKIKDGKYQEALDIFHKVHSVFEEIGAEKDKAKTLQNIGILYSMVHEFDKSRTYLFRSLNLWQKLGNDNSVARVLFNIGALYNELGYNVKAKEFYHQALTMHRSSGYTRGIAYCLSNLASIYSDEGNYAKAIEYFAEAGTHFSEMGLLEEFTSSQNNMGLALKRAGRVEEALESFRKVVEMNDQIDVPLTHAHALYHIGIVYQESKEYEKSLPYITRSQELFSSLKNRPDVAKAQLGLGLVYEGLGDADKALNYYKQGIESYLSVFPAGDYFKLAHAYDLVCHQYLKSGDLKKALEYNGKSFASLLPEDCEVPETCWQKTSNGLEFLHALNTKISILNTPPPATDSQDLTQAKLRTFETGLSLIDSLRSSFRLESRRVFMETASELFEQYLRFLHELHTSTSSAEWSQRAFYVMERYRNHWLSEMQLQSGDLSHPNATAPVVEKERLLRAEIGYYTEKLLNEKSENTDPDPTKLKEYSRILFAKNNSYDSLLEKIKNEHPSYFQLIKYRPVISAGDIQQKLTSHQLLLEYFTGKEAIFLVALARNQILFEKIDLEAKLSNAIVGFSEGISRRTTAPKKFNSSEYTEPFVLFDKLVSPVLEDNAYKELIVIPDGVLGYFPFEAFLTDRPTDGQGYRHLNYLIKDFEVSYHYSSALFANSPQKKGSAENTFIGFAPSFKGTSEAQLLAFNETVRSYMENSAALPYAEEEVSQIAALMKGVARTGEKATESYFKTLTNKYRIIHLASHSLIDDADPLYSKLIFDSEHDTIEDGLLHTYEIYNMQLNADLVCLSACNTGIGKYYRGEGIVSLARGFMHAGVPNVMMSLWPVADRPTKDIMQYFYEEIEEGNSYAAAIRMAKLRYLENADDITADPYYWSSFVYLGQPSASISYSSEMKKVGIGIAAILAFCISGLVYLRRKKG